MEVIIAVRNDGMSLTIRRSSVGGLVAQAPTRRMKGCTSESCPIYRAKHKTMQASRSSNECKMEG